MQGLRDVAAGRETEAALLVRASLDTSAPAPMAVLLFPVPVVVGELACGPLGRRGEVLELLRNLPQAPVVDPNEVLAFVDGHALMGSGLGWVDVHLLASAALAGERFWTRDRRLARSGSVRIGRMDRQLEPAATGESNGGEVAHVARREAVNAERLGQRHHRAIDEAQTKIREASVHLHRT